MSENPPRGSVAATAARASAGAHRRLPPSRSLFARRGDAAQFRAARLTFGHPRPFAIRRETSAASEKYVLQCGQSV